MARGLPPGLDFRVAIPDIKSITINGGVEVAAVAVVAASIDSPRASGGHSTSSGRGRPARRLERAAEGVGASAGSGHAGGQSQRRDLTAGGGRRLALAGETGFDPAGLAGCRPLGKAMGKLAKYTYATHIKDLKLQKDAPADAWYFFSSTPVGDGIVNNRKLSELLAQAGYKGFLAVEIDFLHPDYGNNEDAAVAKSVDALRAIAAGL